MHNNHNTRRAVDNAIKETGLRDFGVIEGETEIEVYTVIGLEAVVERIAKRHGADNARTQVEALARRQQEWLAEYNTVSKLRALAGSRHG
ncbi:MAG: hypothetical protein JXQ99_28390 [Hyphomicrobiaceae bacterium]